MGRTARGVHKRLNFGVIFVANSQFSVTNTGHKVKPDWPRIGEPCFEGNTQAVGDRK